MALDIESASTILVIVNNASTNTGAKISVQFPALDSLDMYLKVKLPVHIAIGFLIF